MEMTSNLWGCITAATRHALAAGALHPIETRCDYIEEDGISFAVRRVSSLERKEREAVTRRGQPRGDPFLPYERDLYVADLGARYVVLLNKYNVFDHHVLLVTREYEDQEQWLTQDDFEALWCCMAAFDGLGFYNGGRRAGASQPHKHLQVVPLPLAGVGNAVPIAPLFTGTALDRPVNVIPRLPYVHAAVPVRPHWLQVPRDGGREARAAYAAMLHAVGLSPGPRLEGARQSAPYNLIATREWMLLVPRRRETYHSITINSLGLAGALLVKDDTQFTLLKRRGPMAALTHVTLMREPRP